MKTLVLGISAASLILVAIAGTRAILSDAAGPESAGPTPSAYIPRTRQGTEATAPGENASIDTENPLTESGVPKVDYTIDLNSGVMTPLPKAIIRSLGKSDERGPYAPQTYASLTWYAASRDRSLLAYVGTGEEGSNQIFTAGIDGTGVRQVTHDPKGATTPAWSPNGNMIAYEGYGSGDVRHFFALDVATGETRQVTDGAHDVSGPQQFTPDGSSLLYTAGPNCCPVLRTVPIAGGKSTVLIDQVGGLRDAGNGSLSPDGSLVTFLGGGAGPGTHCGPCRVVANADGTDLRVIPRCLMLNPAGAWSPDGSRIVCLNGSAVVVVDIATGETSRLAEGIDAIWLDRHTLLVEVE